MHALWRHIRESKHLDLLEDSYYGTKGELTNSRHGLHMKHTTIKLLPSSCKSARTSEFTIRWPWWELYNLQWQERSAKPYLCKVLPGDHADTTWEMLTQNGRQIETQHQQHKIIPKPIPRFQCHQPLSEVKIRHWNQECRSKGPERIMWSNPSSQRVYTPHTIHCAETVVVNKSLFRQAKAHKLGVDHWIHSTEPDSQLFF